LAMKRNPPAGKVPLWDASLFLKMSVILAINLYQKWVFILSFHLVPREILSGTYWIDLSLRVLLEGIHIDYQRLTIVKRFFIRVWKSIWYLLWTMTLSILISTFLHQCTLAQILTVSEGGSNSPPPQRKRKTAPSKRTRRYSLAYNVGCRWPP
jgi:hypothetical protein